MSRPTDSERGARIALAAAVAKVAQRDLFRTAVEDEIWCGIYHAADEALDEADALREAMRA